MHACSDKPSLFVLLCDGMVLGLVAKPRHRKSLQQGEYDFSYARAYSILSSVSLRCGSDTPSPFPASRAALWWPMVVFGTLFGHVSPLKSRKGYVYRGQPIQREEKEGLLGCRDDVEVQNRMLPALTHPLHPMRDSSCFFFSVIVAACRASMSACWKRRWLKACHQWVAPNPLLQRCRHHLRRNSNRNNNRSINGQGTPRIR